MIKNIHPLSLIIEPFIKKYYSYAHKQEIAFLKNTKDLLIKKGWTRFQFARNKIGRSVSIHSNAAASFCLMGALFRTEFDFQSSSDIRGRCQNLIVKAIAIKNKIKKESYRDIRIAKYNDKQAKDVSDIISIIDEALIIARTKTY